MLEPWQSVKLYWKETSAQEFFNLLTHIWVLEQNLYFCRTHSDGSLSSSYLELQMEMKLKLIPSFLPSLITYLLTHLFYLSSARTILSKLAGLKYYKCFSRSSLCHTMLSSPLLYHTTLYYTILGIKAYVMPVASQCCKVKFITKGPTTSCNQRIW